MDELPEEQLTRLACPKCGSTEELQLEEVWIATYNVDTTEILKLPARNSDTFDMDSAAAEEAHFTKEGGTDRVTCYSEAHRNPVDNGKYSWSPPDFVIRRLWKNEDEEGIEARNRRQLECGREGHDFAEHGPKRIRICRNCYKTPTDEEWAAHEAAIEELVDEVLNIV